MSRDLSGSLWFMLDDKMLLSESSILGRRHVNSLYIFFAMSTMSGAHPPTIATVSGPWLLGCLFNWGLFGVLSLQVYIYYLAFPNDTRISKCLVYGLYLIETAQTVLLTHDAFNIYATHFGDLDVLTSVQLQWLSIPIFGGIVSCAVQVFYGYRVKMLSGSNVLAFVIISIAVVQFTAAIVQGAQAFVISQIPLLASKAFVTETIWLAGSAACDLIIAVSMTFILIRKDTKLPATHAVITKLVVMIVETGCLTALAATLQIALFLRPITMPYFTCVGLALAKLYSNSLLAIFNSRIRIRGAQTCTPIMKTDEPSLAFGGDTIDTHPSLPVNIEGGNMAPVTSIVDIRRQEDSEAWTNSEESVGSIPLDERKSKIVEVSGVAPLNEA
ncbi:hypothetical protein SCHPADRAFT_941395 [Schizopora paradoxa]|uniref:DUF6534 domain-containing protein n=1 Tax=Schizopora paradoxa TaxID=27342 RepID=A0A0H2RRW8_9AGAM|nr:hypothetical protein SCHPADRAFT_941395 [Schizopora paradoxa]